MKSGFHIAPFIHTGESVGNGFWEYARLSPKWLEYGRSHLLQHGMTFDSHLAGNLSHVRIKLTSASAAGIMSIFVTDQILESLLFLGGLAGEADAQAARMFVDSLRKSKPVIKASSCENPFEKVLEIIERPLLVTIPWPANCHKRDHDIAGELGLHFAGAFFLEAFQHTKN